MEHKYLTDKNIFCNTTFTLQHDVKNTRETARNKNKLTYKQEKGTLNDQQYLLHSMTSTLILNGPGPGPSSH